MSFDALSLSDLAKILGGPLLLALLVRYLARRDKTNDDAAKVAATEATEATQLLKTRSETAEQEREALRADGEKNKTDHARFQQKLEEMLVTVTRLQTETQNLRMDMTRSDMRGEATKETMARIDGQLGRLIDTYRTLS